MSDITQRVCGGTITLNEGGRTYNIDGGTGQWVKWDGSEFCAAQGRYGPFLDVEPLHGGVWIHNRPETAFTVHMVTKEGGLVKLDRLPYPQERRECIVLPCNVIHRISPDHPWPNFEIRPTLEVVSTGEL